MDRLQSFIERANKPEILKQIPHKLPPPEMCDCCKSEVYLALNSDLYGSEHGRWPLIYLCKNSYCRASIGVHPRTTVPLGLMADKETKQSRRTLHDMIDPIWKSGRFTRQSVYHRLAMAMKLQVSECHVGHFNNQQCQQAIAIVKGWKL